MQYRPELDGLRAIAVAAVVLFHSDPFGPFSGGFIGVDLFFVLSSFLITAILANEMERTGRIDLPRFFYRRAIRLIPALLLMLAAYLAVAPLIWPEINHGRDAMLAGLYLSDITMTIWRSPHVLQHSWSLALEEQFYIVWPFVLPLLLRARRPLLWLALAYLAMTLWRGTVEPWRDYYYRPDMHGTGLVLGAALYFAGFRYAKAGFIGIALFAAVCLTAFIPLAHGYIPVAEIAAALMITGVMAGGLKPMGHPVLAHVGKLSYAIYLWHFPIALALRDRWDFAPTAAATLAASYLLALISYHTVEAWGRRMKRKEAPTLSPGIA